VSRAAWIWIGLILGSGAGVLGAYVGWKRSRAGESDPPRMWVAAVTLALALSLGAVVSRIRLGPSHRLLLLLPVMLLLYWFTRQVRAIRAARGKGPGDATRRCQRK